ncbi:MAG: energy transducer TonB [Candidatus Kuenenia sp.]|nr:energy transducer TonB [Candidatus Kuenenia hertensis]
MFNDKIIIGTFIISLTGHILLLGMPGFSPSPLQIKKPEEITVRMEIEKPPLLPKIDIMGEKKKIEEAAEIQKETNSEPKHKFQSEEVVTEKHYEEPVEEIAEKPKEFETKPESELQSEEAVTEEPTEEPVEKMAEKPEEAEPEPELQSEEITTEKPPKEPRNEKIEVIDPAQEAMFRYQDMVKQRIEDARKYPYWAKKQGMEGIVYLSFTVLSRGSCRNIFITRSSGSKIFDDEAVNTVKRASPFPPIPEEISSSYIRMEVAVVFVLH